MRYRISFLALRRSAIITNYIQRDQNWANSAGRCSWGGGSIFQWSWAHFFWGGGGSIFQWSWDHFFQDQDARHIWILLELYYIGNQLAAINFLLHVLYISEGDQCATCCVRIDFSNVQRYLLSFSHTIANSCIISCLLSNNSQQTSTS